MHISVVVPLLNEQESLPELAAWIEQVMLANRYQYEIIFIDDGSRDRSWEMIEQLSETNSQIKGIKFRRNYGKSAALSEGFNVATGDVIVT
ncbi:MAG: glycosyltransferase, partial [Chitinophagales bacterium]|nr:glycosyltransferase [Chitinophagales bacterium]